MTVRRTGSTTLRVREGARGGQIMAFGTMSTTVAGLTFGLLGLVPTAPAQEPCEAAKLLASDGATCDRFGDSLSLFGDTALVGAPGDAEHGSGSGSAYVLRKVGGVWVQEAKLTASDGAPWDEFSYSVSLSGDTALVGAPYDDDRGTDSGSAYLFRNVAGVWVQEAKVTASEGAPDDYFGQSVSLSGDTALVGAWADDDDGTDSGSAYVFRNVGGVWVQEAKLTASDAMAYDYFGTSVSLSGDTALVGAQWGTDQRLASGSAYVFRDVGGAWIQDAKLTAADGAPWDEFGYSVSLSGDTALVGAHWDDDHGEQSGSAYVFRHVGSMWVHEAKLLPDDGAPYDEFAVSVSLSGDTALLGTVRGDGIEWDSGSAYVFRKVGAVWVEEAELAASDGAQYDNFGCSVSLSGDTALVGAWADDDHGESSGSAYVFVVAGADCNGNGTFDQCDIADGTSEDCNANSVPDECDIAEGTSQDQNGNGVPDECECFGDLDGDNDTDLADLGILLGDYGCSAGQCEGDLNADGRTNLTDLAILLSDYGCER